MGMFLRRSASALVGLIVALMFASVLFAQNAFALSASPDNWFKCEYMTADQADEAQNNDRISYSAGEGVYIKGLTSDANGSEIVLPRVVGGNTVVYADVSGEEFDSLDATLATGLKYLDCSYSGLQDLYLSNLRSLKELYCNNNFLRTLSLDDSHGLTTLNCSDNLIGSLSLSGIYDLQNLYCSGNRILDVSGLAASGNCVTTPQGVSIRWADASINSVVYNGTGWFVTKYPGMSVSLDENSLVRGKDYYVAGWTTANDKDNTSPIKRAGTYKISLVGAADYENSFANSAYTGEVAATFVVKKAALANAIVIVPNKAYTGNLQKPVPAVKVNGYAQLSDEYKTTYHAKKNVAATVKPVKVGTYWAKVVALADANTSGTAWRSFRVNPKATAYLKVTALNNGFKASWAKRTVQVTGYQVSYKQAGKTSWTTKNVTSYKTNVKSVTGLKDKKSYDVRVRTYKTVNGTRYYSAWTAVKTVKTK